MNLHSPFRATSRSRSTRLRSRLACAAIFAAALCVPGGRLLAQQTSSNQIGGVAITEGDGTSFTTDSNQGVITVKLPHSDTTLAIDVKNRTFVVTSNKTGGSTPQIQTFPPPLPGTSFSTGNVDVSVTVNNDLSVSVSVSNGNDADAFTVKTDVNRRRAS